MNIILGFGKTHYDKAKQLVNEMASKINSSLDVQKTTGDYAEKCGVYKTKKYEFKNMNIRTVHSWSNYKAHWGCTVEGCCSFFRDDHPLSPDGFACLDIHFCLTIQEDDIWGRREYIAL